MSLSAPVRHTCIIIWLMSFQPCISIAAVPHAAADSRHLQPQLHRPDETAALLNVDVAFSGEKLLHMDTSSSQEEVNIWPGLLMASIAGASTVLGATVILFMPEEGPPPSAMAFSLSLAAGVMIAVSFEMLLPSEGTSTTMRIGVFFLGAACCAALCKIADIIEGRGAAEADSEKGGDAVDQDERKRFRLAALLFVSLTLHNFPEGFAVAVSALSGLRLGITMCIAVAFHNIPEGIALAVSIYSATKSYGKSFFWTFVSGMAEPLGAICAMLLIQAYLRTTPDLIVHLLTAVAGVMCYIAIMELLPEAMSKQCWPAMCGGFVTGVVIMVVTHMVLDSASEAGHLDHMHSH